MAEPYTIDRLIFIFNADAGLFNAAMDSAKKLLRINDCPLCSITHGIAGEKSEMKSCRSALGLEVEYLHRDELTPVLVEAVGDELPCVLADVSGELIRLLGPDALARCRGSVGDLRGRLRTHAAMKQLVLPENTAA